MRGESETETRTTAVREDDGREEDDGNAGARRTGPGKNWYQLSRDGEGGEYRARGDFQEGSNGKRAEWS